MTTALPFQVVAVPVGRFAHLFSLNDAELAEQGARRMVADEKPSYPCRISLVDADIGEQVILTTFRHHDVTSPWRASGPVFVRESAVQAEPGRSKIPEFLRHRLLSARAYDHDATLKGAKIIEGHSVEEAIGHFFARPDIAYLQLHNAGLGCFLCEVRRT